MLCNAQGCTACYLSYTLASNGSCQNMPCSVPNCLYCMQSSNLACIVCTSGFSYNALTGACDNVPCPLQFVFQGGICVCPSGYMPVKSECLPCSDMYCLSCNSFGCLTCILGYYSTFNLTCLPCSTNCDICTSFYCIQCSLGFSLSLSGVCLSIGAGTIAIRWNYGYVPCDPACSACSLTWSNSTNCTSLKEGYNRITLGPLKCYN
jgi:hypothetical protein